MNNRTDEELAESMTLALQEAGACGDIEYFCPDGFKQPIRPNLPGCNWKTLRMN